MLLLLSASLCFSRHLLDLGSCYTLRSMRVCGTVMSNTNVISVTLSVKVISGRLRAMAFIHSFVHWHVQNTTIPCRSQQLLPFLSVTYSFPPPRSPTSSPSFFTSSFHLFLGLHLSLVVYKFILRTFKGILFSSILCTCPNQHNLVSLIVSAIVGFYPLHKFLYWLIFSNILFVYHILGPKLLYTHSFQKCLDAFYLSLLVSRFLMHMLKIYLFCVL